MDVFAMSCEEFHMQERESGDFMLLRATAPPFHVSLRRTKIACRQIRENKPPAAHLERVPLRLNVLNLRLVGIAKGAAATAGGTTGAG